MASGDQKFAKIQSNIQALSSAANSLNKASDELSEIVIFLDEALRKMNIGLSHWVTVGNWSDELRNARNELGYDKVNGKWGLSLRTIRNDISLAPPPRRDEWAFNDAPRDMRLQAVDQIPDLIEGLSKKAFDLAAKIDEKTNKVRELALAIAGGPSLVTHRVNITDTQVQEIKDRVRKTSKFVAEVLEQAHSWQHVQGELRIYFPLAAGGPLKSLQNDSVAAGISDAARQVLNAPATLVVIVENLATSKRGK